jgi:hypothetical protein
VFHAARPLRNIAMLSPVASVESWTRVASGALPWVQPREQRDSSDDRDTTCTAASEFLGTTDTDQIADGPPSPGPLRRKRESLKQPHRSGLVERQRSLGLSRVPLLADVQHGGPMGSGRHGTSGLEASGETPGGDDGKREKKRVQMTPAGPHSEPSLTSADATPGTGALPPVGPSDDPNMQPTS